MWWPFKKKKKQKPPLSSGIYVPETKARKE